MEQTASCGHGTENAVLLYKAELHRHVHDSQSLDAAFKLYPSARVKGQGWWWWGGGQFLLLPILFLPKNSLLVATQLTRGK